MEPTPTSSLAQPPTPSWPARRTLRLATIAIAGAVALFGIIVLAYELAAARVPQHRAALERLVRAETGLDVRFTELGLRWGWYGPEGVFHNVELGEPGRANVLLRAPELIIGFDVWRTLRSGRPEAGRITLVAPDIDFERVGSAAAVGHASARAGAAGTAANADRARILQRWRGGRIDIEGGTLRMPDPGVSGGGVTVQIRHASLRRSDSEWSAYGLIFLPERLGRTARVVLRLDGDIAHPASLSGSLRFEGHRLLFSGWRELFGGAPDLARALPRAGGGELTLNVDFERGRLLKADGSLAAAGLEFDPLSWAASGLSAVGLSTVGPSTSGLSTLGPPAIGNGGRRGGGTQPLVVERLRGEWRAALRPSGWRVQVDSLEMAPHSPPASLTVDADAGGNWFRGKMQSVPLRCAWSVARWLAPDLQLDAVDLGGTARSLEFDWDSSRPEGERLQAAARLDEVSLLPASKAFTVTGLSGRITANDRTLTADLGSHAARLQLAHAPNDPGAEPQELQVDSELRISRSESGWQLAARRLQVQHQQTRLTLEGTLDDAEPGMAPVVSAHAVLTEADVSWVEDLLGEDLVQAFGPAASRLSAGRVAQAEFDLQGPADSLPFDAGPGGTTGTVTLRDATLSGGDLLPDMEGVVAHIQWHGPRMRATIEAGHAGPLQIESAKAEWDASGMREARFNGRAAGHLEDALAWLRTHPDVQQYVPRIQQVDLRGAAQIDFNLSSAPLSGNTTAHVSALLDGVRLQPLAGLPSVQGIRGALVFDSGHLQSSTLTGTWLGGPVSLRIGERRERGSSLLAIQGRGTLDARQLMLAAAGNTVAQASAAVEGTANWSGELSFLARTDSQPAQWRIRADSALLGVASRLPEPFSKVAGAAMPLHIELAGVSDTAEMRVALGERLRSLLALERREDNAWRIQRGSVRMGGGTALLPAEPVVLLEGHVNRLDLPAYVAAWQQLRQDPSAPAVRAQLTAGELVAAGRSYANVSLLADYTSKGVQLQLESTDLAGVVRWPAVGDSGKPVEVRFAKLSVPDPAVPPAEERPLGVADAGSEAAERTVLVPERSGEGAAPVAMDSDFRLLGAVMGAAADVSIEDLVVQGRSVGHFNGTVAVRNNVLEASDLRLGGRSHDARGSLHCQSGTCRLRFNLESSDAAVTLEDLGFRPDLTANLASVGGDLEWEQRPDRAALATLAGHLTLKLEDGVTRAGTSSAGWPETSGGASASSQQGPSGNRSGAVPPGDRFALLSVPALVAGMAQPDAAGGGGRSAAESSGQPTAPAELHFTRLEAAFDLRDGLATTSDLHFDGDAEILMRGRADLLAHSYDEQVWILRGEGRLPAAVRRFGASPRVAAVWLSLRELFTGAQEDRSRAVLHLQGSWDDPIVVAEDAP